MSIESQLREALSARADEVGGSAGDPYVRVSGAIAVSRRRRRTAAIAGVAALAALAVAIPSLGELGRDTTTPAKKTLILPGPTDPAWSTIATWPTRGSLATDTEFLAQFRAASLDLARVVYAGDVGDDRVVVTVGRPSEAGTDLATIHAGDRGAPAATLTTHSTFEGDLGRALLIREDPTPTGWLLVLAPPQLRGADISGAPTIHADGSVTRPWSTSTLRDGVGVANLVDAPATLTRVRVAGYDGPVQLTARTTTPDPDADGFCGNCKGQDYLDHAVGGTSSDVALTMGLRVADVQTSTFFDGTVDPGLLASLGFEGARGVDRRIYVGLTRLPGGQVLRTVVLGVVDKEGTWVSTKLEDGVPIAAATAERQPVTVSAQTADGLSTSYQVFAPGASSVRLVGDVTAFLQTPKTRVIDGSASFTLPETGVSEHKRVETFDASGALTGTWPLDLPSRDDPYDVMPSRPWLATAAAASAAASGSRYSAGSVGMKSSPSV